MSEKVRGFKDRVLIDDVMSNFDHLIEDGAEDKLKNNYVYGGYPGWDFHGWVWHEQDKFHCEVSVYGTIQQIISADTLKELMAEVSLQYGVR
jgi:hypothetical protein